MSALLTYEIRELKKKPWPANKGREILIGLKFKNVMFIAKRSQKASSFFNDAPTTKHAPNPIGTGLASAISCLMEYCCRAKS